MTPEQFETFLERNDKANKEAIEKHVNGHMREMRATLSEHIAKHDQQWEAVRPYVEGAAGLKMFGNASKWVGGIVVTIAAAWAILFK